jgi:histidine triad (HIT) family protein
MNDCIFCRIVRGDAPARIVYQDEDVTAFHDLHPVAPVHILVVPNHHIPGAGDVEAGDAAMLGKLFTVARQTADEAGVGDGFRLVVNTGRRAGQSVFHLHMHVLGGRTFTWPPG